MLVCDGSKEGTVKTGNHAPPGGVRGGFLPTPSGLDKKTPPRKHSGKVRHNIGLIPENGQWDVIAENRGWWLLIKRESGEPWKTLKLGSKIYRLGKANFNLGWNGSRLAQGGHQALLYASYPEVEEWVIANLVEAHV